MYSHSYCNFPLIGLYTTFIFQKPDPDVAPPLTTPLLQDDEASVYEFDGHHTGIIIVFCVSILPNLFYLIITQGAIAGFSYYLIQYSNHKPLCIHYTERKGGKTIPIPSEL